MIDTLAVIGGGALVYSVWSERLAFGLARRSSRGGGFSVSLAGHAVGRVALRTSSLILINRLSAVMMWASAVYVAYIIYSFE